ncbi:MAG: hypothetical protein U5R30_02265, partial [Deltaproteobacteria bacterium]|nr:hypothetical protein [Deltaproteobacteria bacterium]
MDVRDMNGGQCESRLDKRALLIINFIKKTICSKKSVPVGIADGFFTAMNFAVPLAIPKLSGS